jgi:hypothetical protein
MRLGTSRWVITAVLHHPFGAGLMAIARGLRLSGSRVTLPVSQPAQAVGRFKLARQDDASGHQQVGDHGGIAPSIRCGAYGNRPRLAPKRLTGYITCEPTSASGWADLNQPARTLRLGTSRWVITAVLHHPFGAGLMAIARGLRLSGSQVTSPVSQPAQAVGPI